MNFIDVLLLFFLKLAKHDHLQWQNCTKRLAAKPLIIKYFMYFTSDRAKIPLIEQWGPLRQRIGLIPLILSFIYPFFFFHWQICITVFSGSVKAGIFKFSIHMENDWLFQDWNLASLLLFFYFFFFFIHYSDKDIEKGYFPIVMSHSKQDLFCTWSDIVESIKYMCFLSEFQ